MVVIHITVEFSQHEELVLIQFTNQRLKALIEFLYKGSCYWLLFSFFWSMGGSITQLPNKCTRKLSLFYKFPVLAWLLASQLFLI